MDAQTVHDRSHTLGSLKTTASFAEHHPLPTGPAQSWGLLARLVFRFFFAYWLLYSLPIILNFPSQLATLAVQLTDSATQAPAEWVPSVIKYLGYPSSWFNEGVNWFAPRVSQTLLGLEVQPPTDFSGSGDRLFHYCTCFTFLVLAVMSTVVWSAASELWRLLKTNRRPNYDRLHTLLRAVVRFHLLSMLLVYGAIKIWCAQFPPITDGQLETKYGDSSPMGLLWRFMQFSQPYTSITGIVEFSCGLLLISRRTTLLGALCAAGATLHVFLLNMCYDVPVKLMSGHLLLMALTLIAPDARRLFCLFVVGRPVQSSLLTPLFGGWKWLNRAAVVVRTFLLVGFAVLLLLQNHQEATTRGVLAAENPVAGRWVAKEFVRDGQKIPFPEQPENPPPRQVTPSKWQGGPGIPPVVRVGAAPRFVTLMFEDGSGVAYRNTSRNPSELALARMQDGHPVARLQASFPEPDTLVLQGPLDGQEVQITLRRIPTPKKEWQLLTRGFHWVQEQPFNR